MKRSLGIFLLLTAGASWGDVTSLNLGLDYRVRALSITNPDYKDSTKDAFSSQSQVLRAYMTAWLNEDVEAALRVQSLSLWGAEGSGKPITRYPSADGSPWIEEAYIHLPHFFWGKTDLVVGRQPYELGDGTLVASDQLGFNGLRARFGLWWGFDVDILGAKVQDKVAVGINQGLVAGTLGWERGFNRWTLSCVQESRTGAQTYVLATGTTTSLSDSRRFYSLRLHGNLKDAYYKLEYDLQDGSAAVDPVGRIALSGQGYKIELGAQNDTPRYGRFGVRGIFASGSADDPGTKDQDEAFRPTYAHRWDGFERAGYGQFFAATLSDALDPTQPYARDVTGLPSGFSGVRTLGLGVFTTQKVNWTGALDYYTYETVNKPTGSNKLGAEVDADITYRYTGFVTLNVGVAYFIPGEVFGPDKARAMRTYAEAHVRF